MIVKDNSPIYRIPKEIGARDILLFEGVRYSANMALVSYGRLRAGLHQISVTDNNPMENYYAALNDAWGVIDSANRFYKLSSKLNLPKLPLHEQYVNFKKLRDGFHHIDEWIDSKHIHEHYPVFGVLSWSFYDPDVVPEIKVFIFSAGIQQGDKNYKLENPLGKQFRVPIDFISLTANQRAKGEPPVKIDMADIIIGIESTVLEIENILNPIFDSLKERENIHSMDAALNFTFK